MPSEITVPVMGESVVEATVAKWLKQQGDPVSLGEPLVELETEKVNTEVAAGEAGVLAQILAKEGQTVKIGDVLGSIGAAGPSAPAPSPPAATPAPAPAAEPASANGGAPSPTAAPAEAPASEVRATPLAQRVAEERGVALTSVPATAPGGKVGREDVETYAKEHAAPTAQATAPAPAPTPAPAPPPPNVPMGGSVNVAPPTPAPAQQAAPAPAPQPSAAPASTGARGETRQRLSRRRLTIARRLVEAQQTAAMLTTFNEVDMTAVMELRKRHRDSFKERHGVGLGFMSFFTKAAVGALKAFPQVNAELQGEELVLRHYHDISIAIGDKEGLVVPVIRNAEQLSFAGIEAKIVELAEKAKTRALTLDDLRGGTFTITNGGVFGSLVSTPILNGTQVGILGMHKIQERPIAVNGEVVIRPMMYLALTYDHRVVDGREAVQFLVKIKELLENPELLLLEG